MTGYKLLTEAFIKGSYTPGVHFYRQEIFLWIFGVRSFYGRLIDNGLSTRSVWCVHLRLRRALHEACRERLIECNPAKGCGVPKGPEHEPNFLRIGQIQRYLKVAEEYGVLSIIYIGLTSGLRQCELFTLL